MPEQEDEPSFVPLRSQSQQQQQEDEVAMPVTLATEQELCQYEKFLDVSLEPCKVLSKGQKKMISQNVAELDSSDISLWATLKNQKAKTPLPRGCKVFLMEIFAGAAVLTSMALSRGLAVAAPIDILLDGTDLLKESVRREIDRHIDEQDPYCLTFAPVCGPWSSWSRLNSAKNEQTAADIALQRDLWYPCLRWMRGVIQRRLKRGRKVLVENPWGSELWSTLCMDKLIQEAPLDMESGEAVELVRGDQCQFGLVDRDNGYPHLKPTGFLTASAAVKRNVNLRCPGDHWHQQLEGGSRTKHAQEWPKKLCKAIIDGFLEEMHTRTVYAAFEDAHHEEQLHETNYDLGSFDYIHDEKDMGRFGSTSAVVDERELHRQEMLEEKPPDTDVMEVEAERKRKWLRAPREVRVALRRLHCMLGHSSNSTMVQMLRTAGASGGALEACKHFACETCKKREPVKRPPTRRPP